MFSEFARPEDAPERGQHLVLIVEDEFLIRLVIAEALRERGYRVIEADNADEALDVLRAGVPIDIIFSDVRMPGSVDGLGLLSFIRSNDSTVAVIMTSGHLDPAEAIACGADAFLPKPYGIDDVVGCLDKYIDQRSVERPWPRTVRRLA